MSKGGSDSKKANGLVALSSAAVLAVYSAGYVRTRAAADRLNAMESRARPTLSIPRGDAPAPPALEPLAIRIPERSTHTPGPVPEPPATAGAAPETAEKQEPGAPAPVSLALEPETLPQPPSEPAAEANPAPVIEVVATVAPAPQVPSLPTPLSSLVVPVPPAPAAAPAPPAKAAAAPALPKAPASPPQDAWKDGTYQGSASARHGSIQATVVIAEGHIASARIDQCWMRYPCYSIDRIVPQVAQRGTPEKIDVISGATESSNVFYWAVLNALSKAK